MLTKLSLLTCFPFQLFQVYKPPLSLEMCAVFGKYGPHLLARRPFRLVKHMVFGVSVFGHVFLRAFKTRAGALLRPLGLPRATFKATTKNTALRRDWRSVWGPFWPKWAWHLRGVHISKKFVFSSFSRMQVVRRVSRSLGGSWASPGTLWGGPGGPTTRARSRPL